MTWSWHDMPGGETSISAIISPTRNGVTPLVACESVPLINKNKKDIESLLHPCCSGGGCPLDLTAPRSLNGKGGVGHRQRHQQPQADGRDHLLNHTTHTSPWRPRDVRTSSDLDQTIKAEQRAYPELILKIAGMEEVHGVDVSWLHHPKENGMPSQDAIRWSG